MAKEFFKNYPDTSTPLTAERLNGLLDGDEPMGNIVVDSIRSKNMFGNYVIINGWIYGTGMRVNSTNGNRMAFIECQPNTTYTISRSVITSTFRVGDYTSIPSMTSSNVDYSLTKEIEEDDSGTTITYTTSSTAKYLIVHYGNYANDSDSLLNNSLASIQVETGSTATTYSPYQELGRPEILTGSGIINSTYIDTAELNHYEKSGNVVSYSFTMKTKGTWGNTTEFISGLPKAKKATRFIGINGNNGMVFRFEIWSNGTIHNAYSPTTPPSDVVLEAHVVYMTED